MVCISNAEKASKMTNHDIYERPVCVAWTRSNNWCCRESPREFSDTAFTRPITRACAGVKCIIIFGHTVCECLGNKVLWCTTAVIHFPCINRSVLFYIWIDQCGGSHHTPGLFRHIAFIFCVCLLKCLKWPKEHWMLFLYTSCLCM